MAESRGLVIAAPASGAGKTLVSLGLIGALARAGTNVAAAKAGPDYIDPRFLEAAMAIDKRVAHGSRRAFGAPHHEDCSHVPPHPEEGACAPVSKDEASTVNLDPWAMRPELVRALAAGLDAELLVIEGVMGLFDGPDGGGGSTADLATLLGLPVVLVIDAAAQGQSAAALARGFADHRADCHVAGVILNRVAGERHARLCARAIEAAGLPVLGAVPRSPNLALPHRHLGLVQAGEHPDLAGFLAAAATHVGAHVDLARLAGLAAPFQRADPPPPLPALGARIALARDEAFAFAYPHLLDAWHAAGAELRPFSPLADEEPDPDTDSVYLPGGYPELHAGRLAAAETFRTGLAAAAERGALVYGECGGFMVLGEALIDAEGVAHPMSGLLPLVTSFAVRGLKLGYRRLGQDGVLPWPRTLRGHEFHYSTPVREGSAEPLFMAEDAAGRPLGPIGMRRGRVMGSYAHVIDMEAAP